MPFFFACFLVTLSTHQKLQVIKEKKREGGSFPDTIPKNRLPKSKQHSMLQLGAHRRPLATTPKALWYKLGALEGSP